MTYLLDQKDPRRSTIKLLKWERILEDTPRRVGVASLLFLDSFGDKHVIDAVKEFFPEKAKDKER